MGGGGGDMRGDVVARKNDTMRERVSVVQTNSNRSKFNKNANLVRLLSFQRKPLLNLAYTIYSLDRRRSKIRHL